MNITSILWGLYLGFAPVYWLPFLGVEKLDYIKTTVLVSAILFTWFGAQKFARLPKGIHGPVGLILILLFSLPAAFQADLNLALRETIIILYGFGAFWSFYVFWCNSKRPQNALILSSIIIAAMSSLTISSYYISVPDWTSPSIYFDSPLHVSGFGSLRTGWSNALSLYVGAIFLILTKLKKPSLFYRLICLLVAALIIGSQFVVGGRAGILSSLFVITFISWFYLPKKFAVGLISIMVLASIYFITDEFLTHLRIDRLQGSGETQLQTLDKFSAGRITSYQYALQKWIESPIIGHGYGGEAKIGAKEIHNMWLKLLAEGGILLFAVFAYFCFRLIKTTPFKLEKLNNPKYKIIKYNRIDYILWPILIQGMILTMFEPNAVLGTFQTSALWWVVAGAYLAQIRLYSRISGNA